MSIYQTGTPVLIFYIVAFTACGGETFDFALPTRNMYAVDAYINDYSLKTTSIIRQDDMISPYFTHPTSNDPDIQGLIVFFQTPAGTLAGKKTWYTLKSETLPPDGTDPSAEPPASGAEFTPPPGAGESAVSLPADEAQTSPALSAALRANVIENSAQYRIILVDRLDHDLPGFRVTDTIEIGYYSLVFQVLGEKELLYSIEKPVCFLGDAVFSFETIQQYLPSASINVHLIPSGVNVLLEAEITADPRLDPYIAWYSGKECIANGLLSAGADRLVWKTPEKNGFHIIKATVYPIKPQENFPATGIIRELSLPVSLKSKDTGYFEDEADRFTHWYRFQSTLVDAKSPADARSSLTLPDAQKPLWLHYNMMYGFGVKSPCFLPDTSFLFDAEEEGTGLLSFHLVPLSAGTVFTATFKTVHKTDSAPAAPLRMQVSFKEQRLILTLTLGDASYQEGVDITGLPGFITPSVSFRLRRSQITAVLRVKEASAASPEITLKYPDFIIGAGTFQLGEAGAPNPVALINELGVGFTKSPLPYEVDRLEADMKPENPDPQTERLAETTRPTETA